MTAPMMPQTSRRRPNQPTGPVQGGQFAQAFQDATNASTAMAREDFQRDVGKTLGGVAAIGGLRSGRVQTAVNDLTTNFGRQVGNVAASNAGQLAALDMQAKEGEANRGVQREGMSMQDRQFGQRLGFDRERAGADDMRDARDFDYRKTSDDREFGYRGERDRVSDMRDTRNFDRGVLESDRGFDRGVMESDREFGYRGQRDTVMDNRDERNYGRSVLESDREFGYRGQRDSVMDSRDERNFNYGRERDQRGDFESDRGYNRSTYESDRSFGEDTRRYNQDRDDYRTSARQQGQGQIIGGILQHGGSMLGGARRFFGGGQTGGGTPGAAGGAPGGATGGGTPAVAGGGGGVDSNAGALGIMGVGLGIGQASAANIRNTANKGLEKGAQNFMTHLEANRHRMSPAQLAEAQKMVDYINQHGRLPGGF